MNKVKMFFIAAALVLTTAGVFAGKSKFSPFTLYAYNTTAGYVAIASGATALDGLQSGTPQVTLSDGTNSYSLVYSDNGGTKQKASAIGW